jgi:hypothetical protein
MATWCKMLRLSRRQGSCKPCTASPQGSASSWITTGLRNLLYTSLHHFIPTIVMSSGLPWQNDAVQQMAFEICFLICFWFRIHPFPKLPKPEHARTEWTAIAAVELDCLDLNLRKNWNPTSGVQIVQTRLDLWCASAVHACGRHFLIQFVCICLCRCAGINSVAASESLVRHLYVHTSTWHRKHILICRERQGRQED